MRDIKVALVQMNALVGKVDKNLQEHRKYVERAAKLGVELLCFPELSITGHWPDKKRYDVAEEVPGGASYHFIEELAREYGMFIGAGIAEIENGVVYNTYFVAGAKGIVGKQRKLHPSGDEYFYYKAGDRLNVFDIGKANVGIVICFDNMFCEVQRCLAVKGAEVIIMPHASRTCKKWPIEGEKKKEARSSQKKLVGQVYGARCYDNGQFGLYCNQVGHAGPNVTHAGGLFVIAPNGEIIADGGGSMKEKMIAVNLQAEMLNAKRKAACFNLMIRRPGLYSNL